MTPNLLTGEVIVYVISAVIGQKFNASEHDVQNLVNTFKMLQTIHL